VGPARYTPGAIRAAVRTTNGVQIITTSRFTPATDGGGLVGVHDLVSKGVSLLINDNEINNVSEQDNIEGVYAGPTHSLVKQATTKKDSLLKENLSPVYNGEELIVAPVLSEHPHSSVTENVDATSNPVETVQPIGVPAADKKDKKTSFSVTFQEKPEIIVETDQPVHDDDLDIDTDQTLYEDISVELNTEYIENEPQKKKESKNKKKTKSSS
jgi:hypothetical protein